MKTGTIVRYLAVWAGVLLATVPVVSANHAATARGTCAVAPEVVFQVHFVVAFEGLTVLEAEWVPTGASLSLQATRIDTLVITTQPDSGRTVAFTGELVSTTIQGAGPARLPIAELVPFTATGLDTVTSGAGPDAFSLTVTYRATRAQGPLLASLGFGTCDAKTCTITFTGLLTEGDLFVHTTGDQ
jgi:hypothetical protein